MDEFNVLRAIALVVASHVWGFCGSFLGVGTFSFRESYYRRLVHGPERLRPMQADFFANVGGAQ